MHFDDASPSNDSANPHLDDLAAGGGARRHFLQQATTVALIAGAPMLVRSAGAQAQAPLASGADPIPFRSVPVGTADTVVVPEGYRVQVLFAWGDPVGDGPAFRQDASNSAADQAQQAGMHHDGMHFFPWWSAKRTDGRANRPARAARDQSRVHGRRPAARRRHDPVDRREGREIAERARRVGHRDRSTTGDTWQVVRPSPYARRITARTPIDVGGPAAGHPLLRTAADPTGRRCSARSTTARTAPRRGARTSRARRTSTATSSTSAARRRRHGRAEGAILRPGPLRHREGRLRLPVARARSALRRVDGRRTSPTASAGWSRSIPATRPRRPVKRTALGRFKHEGASVVGRPGRPRRRLHGRRRALRVHLQVRHARCDPSRRPCRQPRPARRRARSTSRASTATAAGDLAAAGARTGRADRRERLRRARPTCCVHTRAGGRRRRRDEDGPPGVDRGPPDHVGRLRHADQQQPARRERPARPPIRANPRPDNVFGHILRSRRRATTRPRPRSCGPSSRKCGDPALGDPNKAGRPEGRHLRQPGRLLVRRARRALDPDRHLDVGARQGRLRATSGTTRCSRRSEHRGSRRFLVGPRGCEITGVVTTPDQRSMFVDIQHPGEPARRNATIRPRRRPFRPGPTGRPADGRARQRS